MHVSLKGRKPKLRYTKIVVNIPSTLIDRFDKICEREGYARQEAIKQALRDFIYDYTDENDTDPQQMREFWKSMVLGMAEAAKEIPQSQQPALK